MITGLPRVAIAAQDFDALVDGIRQLGLPVLDLSARTVPDLGARIAMAVPEGGSHVELMSPASPDAPLAQSLQRFLDRRGEGLFALMLEAPDPDAEAEALAARGLRVLPRMAGAGGRDVHPASCHGVLIRVYPVDSFTGRAPVDAPPAPTTGIVRAVAAVSDLDRARRTFVEGFGLREGERRVDAADGVVRLRVHPPAGAAIELVAVHDSARPFAAQVAAHLASRGEGLFALAFARRDGARSSGAAGGDDGSGATDPSGPTVRVLHGARLIVEPAQS